MEHLHRANGARQPTLYIPLVTKSASEYPYTFLENDFIHFPKHHLEEIHLIHHDISPRDAFLSLIQSWLYFGTLTEFFKGSISSETFSRLDGDGNRVLCTSALHELRSAWIDSLPRRSCFTGSHRQIYGRRCAVVLARTTWAYGQLEDAVTEDAVTRLVMFSVKIMLCSLCQVVRAVLGPTPTLDAVLARLAFRPAVTEGGSETDFLLWSDMVSNGWCPWQINRLLRIYTPTSMVYLSSVQRERRQRDHGGCLEAGCCKAAQIDWASFQTPHVGDGCTCGHIAVDERHVMEKLDDGQIPLLSCTKTASGEFSVRVIHADMRAVFGMRTAYIAMSHVWADGLGNPAANSLPKCQFEKLYHKLKALSKAVDVKRPWSAISSPNGLQEGETPIVFWMDVFCIPVARTNSQRHTDLKQRAIAMMDLIYSCADQVLVIDSEMEGVATTNSENGDEASQLKSSTEALARFTTCSWMGRSWTLQEGALAGKLWAYYSGSPTQHAQFNAFHVPAYLADEAPPEILAAVEELQSQASLPFVGRGGRDMSGAAMYCRSEREVQFLEVWNSLIGRSTTQPEDFHCIVANLLDYSVQELFKLGLPERSDDENRCERMKAIILAQRRLPIQLFCLPRTHDPNSTNEMAWLPERPIEPRLSEDSFTHAVRVSNEGFSVEAPCLRSSIFAWPPRGSGRSFCLNLRTRNGMHPHVSLDLPEGVSVDDSELFIYLNVSTKANSLLSDCKYNGAAFRITGRQAGSLNVEYLCSLIFRHRWDIHDDSNSAICVPATVVNNNVSVLISGPGLSKALKFRRPLRVGTGLVATLPSKFLSTSVLFGFGGGLLLILLLSLPFVREGIFHLPVSDGQRGLLYLVLVLEFVTYFATLSFICARYLSGPLVKKTYLTDKLPWYIKVLYPEILPTDTKLIILGRRMYDTIVSWLLYRRELYETHDDRHVTRRVGLFTRFNRRVTVLWRRRTDIMTPTQDYTDDYDSGIRLLPTNESDSPFRDSLGPSSTLSPEEDDIESEAMSCIGLENAERLQLIRRALVATSKEDTGLGLWDVAVCGIIASLWLMRIDRRRTVKDYLYDIGIISGGQISSSEQWQ